MTAVDPLRKDLCRLARALEDAGVPLYLAGGYGLLLKAEHLRDHELRTLAPVSYLRATRDLDLFLTADVVVEAESMGAVRDALRTLGYRPKKKGARNYQWIRSIDGEASSPVLKVDVLGQIPEDESAVSLRARRMRPRDFTGLHANPVREAQWIDTEPVRVEVCDDDSGVLVNLPHPFNYLLLKLFAFRDRMHDEEMDFGRHHAFDLYRIVAMVTPEEWDQTRQMARELADTEVVGEAREIVRAHFSDPEALGSIRVREHIARAAIDVEPYPVVEFLDDLAVLLMSEGVP